MSNSKQIAPGITVAPSGEATIDASLKNVLFDLALNLEGPTGRPVDIQHVVAAILLAAQSNQIDAERPLVANDVTLIGVLTPHVKSIFERYGGNVGKED